MVPEEAAQLGEKFDKLGWNEIQRPQRHPYIRLKTI